MKCFSVLLLIIFTTSAYESSKSHNDFSQSVWMDVNKSYRLSWNINRKKSTITFKVEVEGERIGWIGLGISRGLKSKNTDLWMGWVDAKGNAHLQDCHGDHLGRTKSDKSQDLKLIDYYESKEFTAMEFERKLDTCDKNDFEIKKGTQKFISAWGAKNPNALNPCSSFLEKHAHIVSRRLDLLYTLKKIDLPADVKHVDFRHEKVIVPSEPTTYWCTTYKASDFGITSPHHIVEIAPVIQDRKLSIIHHMKLTSCRKEANETVEAFSGRCFGENTPESIQKCGLLGSLYIWAPGSSKFQFPENVGYPIGTSDSSHYFILQVHYNNKFLQKDLKDSSGVRLFYTKPRKYEAAMITLGTIANDNLLIPPGMEKWTVKAYCPKECSQRMQPSRSIFVIASLPHAHHSASAMRTTVVRNGTEVAEIVRDDNFDFHYQHYHQLHKPVEVKPGDELFTYCTYNSVDKKYATVGGKGTDKEMCLNFVMYYPKMNLVTCVSDEIVTQPVFSTKYAKPVFADCQSIEMEQNTWRFANWTGVEWTKSMKEELFNFYNKNEPHPIIRSICKRENGVDYNLPVIYRPIVKKRLKKPRRKCLRNSRGKMGRKMKR